jgi:hypothetical protein
MLDHIHVPDINIVARLLKQAGTTLECELSGASMGSSIPDGSRLRLRFVHEPELAIGDVVAFDAAGTVIVHRIVGLGRFGPARSYVVTRGDGSLLIDHPVPRAAVLGIVQEWTRDGRWQRVPAYSVSGLRFIAGQLFLWPVLVAQHVQHRLAKAITVSVFTARGVLQKLRRS